MLLFMPDIILLISINRIKGMSKQQQQQQNQQPEYINDMSSILYTTEYVRINW